MKAQNAIGWNAVFGAGLLLSACPERVDLTPVSLSPPLVEIMMHGHDEAFLHVMEDVVIADLCNMKAFAGLKTGMTSQEVAEVLGPSRYTSKERSGLDDVSSFLRDTDYVDTVRQHRYDSEGNTSSYRWFLRVRPSDRRLEAHLSPEILAAISAVELAGSYSLVILNSSCTIDLIVEADEVSSILWLAGQCLDPP